MAISFEEASEIIVDWDKIDEDFLDTTIDSLTQKADENETNLKRIMDESVGGELDFKLQMDEEQLYLVCWHKVEVL